MKRFPLRAPALLLAALLSAGCRGQGGPPAGEIDAWYIFPGEQAPFEGFLIHPEDMERILWHGDDCVSAGGPSGSTRTPSR